MNNLYFQISQEDETKEFRYEMTKDFLIHIYFTHLLLPMSIIMLSITKFYHPFI